MSLIASKLLFLQRVCNESNNVFTVYMGTVMVLLINRRILYTGLIWCWTDRAITQRQRLITIKRLELNGPYQQLFYSWDYRSIQG